MLNVLPSHIQKYNVYKEMYSEVRRVTRRYR